MNSFALRASAAAQEAGPYNAEFPAGGGGFDKPLPGLSVTGPWTIEGWVQPSELGERPAPIAGLGAGEGGVYLALDQGRLCLEIGGRNAVVGPAVKPGQWRFVAARWDGARMSLYVDGASVGEAAARLADLPPVLHLAPRTGGAPFAGRLAGFTFTPALLSVQAIADLAHRPFDPALVVFDNASPTWPVQIHGMVGLLAPQEPSTLPKSAAPVSRPVAIPAYAGPPLQPLGPGAWSLPKWRLVAEPKAAGGGAAISQPGYEDAAWYAATVPGTVLTTLVDRGVYPDPEYGLNNMAIPESLARQAWWYRSEFPTPAANRRFRLTFRGVNYAAEVWLNGSRIGDIKGAFVRGRFDVTNLLRPGGMNALAVRISPPPHPGIPHEQSLAAGSGENGGMQALDGPTFFATEGWDWIPGVRDRNSGLWQEVELSASGPVRLGDPQVVTTLPDADRATAEVEIQVPVENAEDHPVQAVVVAAFDTISVSRTATLPPGASTVGFTPRDFPVLRVAHPRLWWPNGYGEPALHSLHLTARVDGQVSDGSDTRFGMRQITYELSLMDSTGHERRVEIDPARARQLGQTLTDGRHEGIRKAKDGWIASLAPGAETSPAVHTLPESPLAPYLVIKVNGVRIAARGGSWGMDDWRKRVSRERLEPFFRLHREAHLNIIRNWVGQDTEDVFFDLADEYGLLVLNDFWDSTQDFQLEPDDAALFLKNAADVIARYRNHPSIALWFGRNEGVPPPTLNAGLERLVRDLDGTRYYSGSSNRVNLQDSGPYDYRPPARYFTDYAKGFAVEVGSPSFPTLEAFEAFTPPADRWPISDDWAYHDWHQSGNGATQGFLAAMTQGLGAPTGLEDFERKAQLMNYDTYRAIFEGMNAELWTRTSGRMLWMTQPAWPSTMWQIYSHDYDTPAAYYAVRSAAEPVHIQLRLPDYRIQLTNNTQAPLDGLTVRLTVLGLGGERLAERQYPMTAAAGATTDGPASPVADLVRSAGAVVADLRLEQGRRTLSRNTYWLADGDAASRRLNAMPPEPVSLAVTGDGKGGWIARLKNQGRGPALNLKLTLFGPDGARVLPTRYSDNYLSLLPGEERVVTVSPGAAGAPRSGRLALRGWNVQPASAALSAPAR